jgi:hypothetical protein
MCKLTDFSKVASFLCHLSGSTLPKGTLTSSDLLDHVRRQTMASCRASTTSASGFESVTPSLRNKLSTACICSIFSPNARQNTNVRFDFKGFRNKLRKLFVDLSRTVTWKIHVCIIAIAQCFIFLVIEEKAALKYSVLLFGLYKDISHSPLRARALSFSALPKRRSVLTAETPTTMIERKMTADSVDNVI